ncbi:peptide ABC transporter ATP-binding protein [Polaromonas sp. C04]|nr:peptide ABC transporter ATP-binding protein [Polaromonas sp. C04]
MLQQEQPPASVLMQVERLRKWYPLDGGWFGKPAQSVKAVDGVSFEIHRGEVLSLVGESGSGKSTIGRAVLNLDPPTAGQVHFDGKPLVGLTRRQMRPLRRAMQMVFQDPYSSLNPKHTVEELLSAPLEIHVPEMTVQERRERIDAVLKTVGLNAAHRSRYPHEFSGGQRQRIGIARALMTQPQLLVADEPVSSLDVSVQAQVINLLLELKQRLGLTMLFISHDLAVVGHISDRIAVMYLGRLVEIADAESLLNNPRHPYTRALMAAVPNIDPRQRGPRELLKGDIPSPLSPPSGCAFRTRCPHAQPACAHGVPELRSIERNHATACIRDDI